MREFDCPECSASTRATCEYCHGSGYIEESDEKIPTMSTADTLGRLIEAATEYAAERDEDGWCQRLKYGQCSLRKCLVQDGKLPAMPLSYDAATCPRWRLEQALRAARNSAPALLACVRALEPFVAIKKEVEKCAAASMGPASDPENWVKACQWEDLLAAAQALAALEAGE